MKTGWFIALMGALFLAAVSTLGDFIWAKWLTHKTVYGVVHGAIMCLCVGLVLGWGAGGSRALWRGAWSSLVSGALISGAFYPMYWLAGMASMFICWMLLWLAFALIYRWLTGNTQELKTCFTRGVMAAVLSGAGFYPMYVLWTRPPQEPSYLIFFLAWTIAFLPGFLPLLVKTGEN